MEFNISIINNYTVFLDFYDYYFKHIYRYTIPIPSYYNILMVPIMAQVIGLIGTIYILYTLDFVGFLENIYILY